MPTTQGRLRLPRIRQTFYRHGTLVQYKRSERCECGSIGDENNPDLTCTDCNGIGWRYQDPITMTVLMTSKNTKQSIERYGILETGSIGVSILDAFRDSVTDDLYQEFIPSTADLMICVDDQMRNNQKLKKGDVHPITGATREKADFLNIIDGTCRISQVDGVLYVEGTDYEITNDPLGYHRIVSWISGGNAPSNGSRYSFTYTTHPSYVLLDVLPKHRRENNLMIMSHVVAKIVSLVEQFQ